MQRQLQRCCLLILFLSLCMHEANALKIGSNTVPSRQGFIIFPSEDTDNAMIGYTSFENGFKLDGSAASCSYDALLPASGQIDLVGGNLYLMESMEISNPSKINTMGSIYGNGKTLKLASSITELRATATDLTLSLTSYNMGVPVSSVDFSTNYSYAIGSSLYNTTDPEILLFYFDGVKLTVTASVKLGTDREALTCRFQPGTLNFAVGINQGVGAQLFSYSYDRELGIFANVSTLNLASGQTIQAVSPSRDGNYLLAGRAVTENGNKTELFMYDWDTITGELGTVLNQHLSEGSHRAVAINAISWAPGGNYLVLGTEVSAGSSDLIIYHFDGVTLAPTIEFETGLIPRGVDYSPTGTFIAVAFEGTTTQNLQIFVHDISNGTLESKTSSYINQTTDGISVAWTADGDRLLFGAALAGGVGSLRQYDFDKTATTLSLVNTFSFEGDISSLRALESEDTYIMGVGNRVYITSGGYADGFTLTADDLTLELSRDIILGTPIGILNDCTILGHDHAIDFDTTGTIIILPNSSLYLKDVTLRNFGGTQLRCFDNSATISLDNVKFMFNSPYYFKTGRLDIIGGFEVSGTNQFIYASAGVSTIYSDATWKFDNFASLSYAPVSNDRQLIQMVDRSSKLAFSNATLYSTATGLSLTKGQLLVDGQTTVNSDAVSTAEAIQWGDGVSASNDLLVTVLSSAQLNLSSGYVINKNIS